MRIKSLINLIFLAIIFNSTILTAVTLKWEIPLDKRLEIVRTAQVKFFKNAKLTRLFEERNIIDLTCYKKNNNSSYLQGRFSVFTRENNKKIFHLEKIHNVDFNIYKSGKYDIAKKYYMPNLRDIPIFPTGNIKTGERWRSSASLVIADFSKPFKLIFDVDYQFIKIVKSKKRKIAIIKYNYLIDKNLHGKNIPPDFPSKIKAKNIGTIYWDIDNNTPFLMKDLYKIIFAFSRGRSIKTFAFEMNIITRPKLYKNITSNRKKKEKAAIQKELPNTKIETEKRGIVIRLGELLFNIDSPELRRKSLKTLESISRLIKKKYPDREIIVEGHTDNTGNSKRNYKLSIDRARNTAKYLKKKSGHDKFSYRGFGADKAIADNNTISGRQKNRRVDIIIKLN